MTSIPIDVITTLAIGGPSLVVAILTWWETRRRPRIHGECNLVPLDDHELSVQGPYDVESGLGEQYPYRGRFELCYDSFETFGRAADFYHVRGIRRTITVITVTSNG